MSVVDLVFDKAEVNPILLHEELKAVLGEKFYGISLGQDPGKVRVHIQDGMPAADQARIEPIVVAHNAAQLTAAQRAEADRAAALNALRKPWAQWTAADQETFLRILAGQAGLIPVS